MADPLRVPGYVKFGDDLSVWDGIDLNDKKSYSQEFKTKIKVYTVIDKKWHDYFYEFSYDAEDTEYMHTARLKAPYSNELMEYWTPISTEVAVYGANRGEMKLLYVGRGREIKQEGYSTVINLQSYGWKFEQLISPRLAQEFVGISCDIVLKMILKALKLKSYTFDEKTKWFLQQFALNENGDVVRGTEELKRIPDIYKRISGYTPVVTKDTINQKLKEDKRGNLADINYTLRWEDAIPTINPLSKQSTADPNIVAMSTPITTGASSPTSTPTSTSYGLVNDCNNINHDKSDNRVKVNGALCVLQKYSAGRSMPHLDKALVNAIDRLNWFWKENYSGNSNSILRTWINTVLNSAKNAEAKRLQVIYLRNQGLKALA
jgi:hypothetical protein